MERIGEDKKTFFSRWFLYFFCYSVIGWCYEVILEVVIYRWGFTNRGVLFGPYCPVYGFGALIFLACLHQLVQKKIYVGDRHRVNITPLLVFASVVVIATAVELLASYLMEWITGSWMWDYRRFDFNFQGRIALNPSLRFGVGGMVFIYVVQPLFVKVTQKAGDVTVQRAALVAALLMAVDFIVTVVK